MASVERSTELPADRDRTWRMLSDEEGLGAWLGGEVSVDLRRGGHLSFVSSDGRRMVGHVVDVCPGRRLTFVWWHERPFGVPRRSRVELTLEGQGDTTLLRLRESQVAPPPVTVDVPAAARDDPRSERRPWLRSAVR